jgi:hypothetical protein
MAQLGPKNECDEILPRLTPLEQARRNAFELRTATTTAMAIATDEMLELEILWRARINVGLIWTVAFAVAGIILLVG